MSTSIIFLKDRIEKMEKYHQIEILRILNKFPEVNSNENNNGTFVNLTAMSPEIIKELEKYTVYVDEQQKLLKKVETEKEEIEQIFF
jgi:flagellar assembly factor FliW